MRGAAENAVPRKIKRFIFLHPLSHHIYLKLSLIERLNQDFLQPFFPGFFLDEVKNLTRKNRFITIIADQSVVLAQILAEQQIIYFFPGNGKGGINAQVSLRLGKTGASL